MLEQAAAKNPTVTLDDLRRDVRLGMGPCQGGFCTFRAVAVLHEMGVRQPESAASVAAAESVWDVAYMQSPAHNIQPSAAPDSALRIPNSTAAANLLLRDFLQARWRGLTPILWGQQLKQERLDELIYLTVMNADHLPDDGEQSPLSEFWAFDTTPSAADEVQP
jgi:glycerol-3-phosphate dehydrogenase